MYLNITHSNGYIKEKSMNKYLVLDSTDENKEKYNVFNGIRDKIKEINREMWLWKRLYEN